MAKTRKSAAKKPLSSKKASSVKKTAGVKKAAAGKKKTKKASYAKELDLRPLKAQLRAHIAKLGTSTSGDRRVKNALAALQRVHAELNEECIPTMSLPLA